MDRSPPEFQHYKFTFNSAPADDRLVIGAIRYAQFAGEDDERSTE